MSDRRPDTGWLFFATRRNPDVWQWEMPDANGFYISAESVSEITKWNKQLYESKAKVDELEDRVHNRRLLIDELKDRAKKERTQQ